MISVSKKIPVVVVGGNGYVSGELLRLLVLHPNFEIAAAASTSHAGDKVAATFPHLAASLDDTLAFESIANLSELFFARKSEKMGLFLATPHGATAKLAALLLDMAGRAGAKLRIVDLSADFRFLDTKRYERLYETAHGAPALQEKFFCAVPELAPGPVPAEHAAHPGCFTTATVLGAFPFFKLGLVENEVFVSAVTGSSGSGRKAAEGTHHPERRSNMYAYSPLGHRHEAEMRMFLGRAQGGPEPTVDFIPHSGPFARGIHATLHMRLKRPAAADELVARVNELYAHTPFVRASTEPPKLIEIAGTNRCRIGVVARGNSLVVLSAIDNMVKGSAGGAIQWMNRLFGLDDSAGLMVPGLGWY